ncbi:hypothetical protein V501_10348 [Pseudogymnoascus sp. VKM F-4519 (FW-2642)]|nr:hypothetical protein V501_10348 [Pseudogymnoascus sp. VKM F-4519 (FW-2642)]
MVGQDAPAGASYPAAPSPISSQARYCLKRFETICDELQNLKEETAIQNGYNRNLVLLTMQDSCAKFKAWGTSIAAFRNVHVPTSLDFRLRDALEIRSTLLGVLEYLGEYLDDAYEIILGNDPNQADDESISSDSENEPEEIASSNSINPAQETSYLQELCMAISSSNASLMKLSILIRKSSNRDDYLKAASRYSTWNPSPFISHVREKYGSAKGSKEWLVERLGKAIMRRRQFLTYREEHHGKLTGDWGEDLDEVVEEKGPDAPKLAKTVASTKATTFIVDGNASKKEVSENEASDVMAGSFGSQTSYEATEFEGDSTAPTKLTVPPPPKWAFPDVPFEYREPFQCPYCYTEQEVNNKAAWKKHIFRDLKPYVCTFAECAMRMYRSRNEWFAHEMQCHRRQWVCQHCQHAAFASASEFSCHLEVTHSEVLENTHLKALILQSEEPVGKIRSNACPLCDEWELDLNNLNQDAKRQHLHGGEVVEPYGTIKQFRRHLGRHMEQLALFALPIKESDDLEDDSDNREDDSEDEADGHGSEFFYGGRAVLFFCDYQNCNDREGFDRKDHCVEHYREYHSEDLVEDQQRNLELLLLKRNIMSVWWRCSKCLKKNQTESGWKCGGCSQMCEKVRIAARETTLSAAESELKAILLKLRDGVSKNEAAESKEGAKPLTSATSETAIEKMEAIMLHYRTALQPACTRFIFSPQATDIKKMDLEHKMLSERLMNEALLIMYSIEAEENTKEWQKRSFLIDELQAVLNHMSATRLIQNGSVKDISEDREGGDNQSSLNRGKPTTKEDKEAFSLGSNDEETKDPEPEQPRGYRSMQDNWIKLLRDNKKKKGAVSSSDDPPAEESVVFSEPVPEPEPEPLKEDVYGDFWGSAKKKKKGKKREEEYPSEEGETTRTSEQQNSLNSTSSAQPDNSSIIDKTEDNKHQERYSIDRYVKDPDSKEAIEPAAESSATEVQMPQERDLVDGDSKKSAEPAAESSAKEVQMPQDRDSLDRDSADVLEPAAESSPKKVQVRPGIPIFPLRPRTTTTSNTWRCKGCDTVNRSTNNCAGCGNHKTQRWVKMIFCSYCGDGPYLAINNISCAQCSKFFDEDSLIEWQPVE